MDWPGSLQDSPYPSPMKLTRELGSSLEPASGHHLYGVSTDECPMYFILHLAKAEPQVGAAWALVRGYKIVIFVLIHEVFSRARLGKLFVAHIL